MAITKLGTTGLIRQSIGDITSARETYEVLRPFKEYGFIVKAGQREVSVCKNTQQCAWYAEKAVLHRGALVQQDVERG